MWQLRDIPREWKILNGIKACGDFDDSNPQPDSKPPKGGKKWQVVKFVHDEPERPILAASFAEWLGQVADAVEGGELSDLIET